MRRTNGYTRALYAWKPIDVARHTPKSKTHYLEVFGRFPVVTNGRRREDMRQSDFQPGLMRSLAMFHTNDARTQDHILFQAVKGVCLENGCFLVWKLTVFISGIGLNYVCRTKERLRRGENVPPVLHPWIRACCY